MRFGGLRDLEAHGQVHDTITQFCSSIMAQACQLLNRLTGMPIVMRSLVHIRGLRPNLELQPERRLSHLGSSGAVLSRS